MEYRKIESDVELGKLAPVYFFFGDESYPIENLTKKIIEKSVDLPSRDFDCDILRGDEIDADKVIGIASSYPMMAQRRVVVLKSLHRFSISDRKRLLTYIEKPLESTSLILIAEKIDRNQGFYSSLMKKSQWCECKSLYENQAVDWVRNTLRKSGISCAHEGATLLVQQVGTSLWILHHEIEKLITYAWGKKVVELEDVLSIVGYSRKFNTWEFTDSVARKDFKKTLVILNHFLEIHQSPVGLIMDLTRRIQLFIRIKTLSQAGVPDKTISKTLGLKPYFARLYFSQVKNFSIDELKCNIGTLLFTDYSIKSGFLDPQIAVTLMVFDFFSGESKNRFFSTN